MNNIQSICVCGAGTMGSGIAQVSAQAGYRTILFDVSKTMLEKSKTTIFTSLQKLIEKNKINVKERDDISARLFFTYSPDDCKADIIIEAIIEKKEAKISLLTGLATINSDTTIFATNTSSISVNAIAGATSFAARIAGMHFFNPAPLMKLVEVVRTEHTDETVIETLINISKQMGKIPVVCKDAPGFIVNRVARHYYLEAMRLAEKGLVDIEKVDTIMESTGFKMGPFELMDLIGLDINYSVSDIIWNALGKPARLEPSTMQKNKIENGDFGRKTGKGFYTY